MIRTAILIATATLMGSTVAGATTSMHLPNSLARISPAEFAGRVTINDDRLEDIIVLSTKRSTGKEGPAKGAWINDAHLRLVIDRASQKASWQVWHDLHYIGPGKDISSVHYLVGGELKRTQPKVTEHWLDQCPATDMPGHCNQLTRVIFELPEEHARKIADNHSAGSRQPWLIRFKDQKGESATVGLAPAELAGLIKAYEAWQARAK